MPPALRAPTAPRLQLCSFVAKGVAPLPWVKFEAFLQKSQGDLRVFVYITWSRIRQVSQYQQKEPDLNRFFLKGDGEEGWRGRMTRKDDDFSPYALVSLRTRLLTVTSVYQPEEYSA